MIWANIFFSTIIHIAAISLLLSFRDSKPIPNSNAPVSLVTLISPRQAQIKPQVGKHTSQRRQAQPSEKSATPKREIAQKSEQSFIPTKAETVEFVENDENTDINEQGEIFSQSGEYLQTVENSGDFSKQYQNFSAQTPATNSPQALYMPKIPYPRSAKNAKIEGVAEIAYIIDSTGRVTSVELLSVPHISFESVIKKSVSSWRFSPATRNGQAVSIRANQTIVFKLD